MTTQKPRFMITIDMETLEQIEDFRYHRRYPTRTKAVVALIHKGLDAARAESRRLEQPKNNSSN